MSAAKPCTGCILKIFEPMVLMIFQPPAEVPRAIIRAQDALAHRGTGISTVSVFTCKLAGSARKMARAMMPITF